MDLRMGDRYAVKNVRNQRRHFKAYVQAVIQHCKTGTLLNWEWNHLDPGLQRDINGPTHSTTVLGFIQQLEDMQKAWKRSYTRKAAPAKQWQPTVQPTRITPERACSLHSPKNEPPNTGMPSRDTSMSSLKFIHYDYQAQQAKKLRKRNGASRRPAETKSKPLENGHSNTEL